MRAITFTYMTETYILVVVSWHTSYINIRTVDILHLSYFLAPLKIVTLYYYYLPKTK